MELLSALPTALSRWIRSLASLLDRRTAPRLAALFFGLLLAAGRRTVTSWFRPAGITDEYRPAYHAVYACGRRTDDCALVLLYQVLRPLLEAMPRLVLRPWTTPPPGATAPASKAPGFIATRRRGRPTRLTSTATSG